MKKEGVELLGQMIKSLEEASDMLDESYSDNDFQKFNKVKKFILQIQDKISEMIA